MRDEIFDAISPLSHDAAFEVREALATALGSFPAKRAFPVLKGIIHTDKSLKTVTAAIRALGGLKLAEGYDTLVPLLGKDSFHDLIRQAVLQGLGKSGDKRALELGLEYAGVSYSLQIRQGAFTLLASIGKELGGEASESARMAIEAALADPGYRTRKAAVTALGALHNAKAIDALTRLMLNDPEARIRTAAKAAIEEINSS